MVKFFVLILMVVSCSRSAKKTFESTPSEISGDQLTIKEFSAYVHCRPLLLSQGPFLAEGFSEHLVTEFGDLRVVRSDISEPNGHLEVYFDEERVCHRPLVMSRSIYAIPGKHRLIVEEVIQGGARATLIDAQENCRVIGWVDISGQNSYQNEIHQSKKLCSNYE